jgi:hypothetical protein
MTRGVKMAFSESLAVRIRSPWPATGASRRRKCSAVSASASHGNKLLGVWKNSMIVRPILSLTVIPMSRDEYIMLPSTE